MMPALTLVLVFIFFSSLESPVIPRAQHAVLAARLSADDSGAQIRAGFHRSVLPFCLF
jgi:hypothetical protein